MEEGFNGSDGGGMKGLKEVAVLIGESIGRGADDAGIIGRGIWGAGRANMKSDEGEQGASIISSSVIPRAIPIVEGASGRFSTAMGIGESAGEVGETGLTGEMGVSVEEVAMEGGIGSTG